MPKVFSILDYFHCRFRYVVVTEYCTFHRSESIQGHGMFSSKSAKPRQLG